LKSIFNINDFLVLLVIIIWGASNTIIKLALREISPMGFVGLRLILSSFFMLAMLKISEKNIGASFSDFLKFTLLGLLGYGIFHPLFTAGLNYTTAADCSIIMATSPLFGVIISIAMQIEKVNKKNVLGILISLIGVFIVVSKDLPSTLAWATRFTGNLLMVGAVISFAFYTVLAKPTLEKNSPLKVNTYSIVTGTVILLPMAIKPVLSQNWLAVSPLAWFVLLFCVIISTGLSYTLWYRGVAQIGPTRTMIYHNLIPVTTISFAIPILGETISFYQVLGAFIAVIGIYIARKG
jgi:drug/metabolite transporter (DMT)-like permease